MKPELTKPPTQSKVPSQEKTLRRLFLTVFLRGQSARGLTKNTVPKSLPSKLRGVVLLYGLMGCMMLFLIHQPVLMLSISMHSLTFLAVGMFVASSAGEALFNKEESEILMHRPVTSQMLLRAKSTVLVQVSLYVSGAVSFVGLFVGVFASNGSLLFPIVHIASTILETLFCIGSVVLLYQICLRWLGRERLDSVMTTLQVVLIVSMTVGSQILPRAIRTTGNISSVNLNTWWLKILPPAWFASLDDAVSGSRSTQSWILGAVGVAVTGVLLWLSFVKLAASYESGIQTLHEASRPKKDQRSQYRFLKVASESFPLNWVLKTSVSKAAFQLVSAYMFRDRETKLRLYPGVAPMMVMPVMLMFTNHNVTSKSQPMLGSAGLDQFFVAMSASYICLLPLTALQLLKFSQQWRAAEVFIAAPIAGPAPLIQGGRVAVVTFLCFPMISALSIFCLISEGPRSLLLVLAGVLALPVFSLLPSIIGNSTPLANPTEEAKSANNMPMMMLSTFASLGVAAAATAASYFGFMGVFLIVEAAISLVVSLFLQRIVARQTWRLYD